MLIFLLSVFVVSTSASKACSGAESNCVLFTNSTECNNAPTCRFIEPGCNTLSSPYNVSCFPASPAVGSLVVSPCVFTATVESPIYGTTRPIDQLHPHPFSYLTLGTTTKYFNASDPPKYFNASDAPCQVNKDINNPSPSPSPPYLLAMVPDDSDPSVSCRAWSVVASYWLNVSDCITARERYGWEFSLCPRNTTRMTSDTNIDPINFNETTPYVCVYTPSVPCSYNIVQNFRLTTHQAHSSCPSWPFSNSSSSTVPYSSTATSDVSSSSSSTTTTHNSTGSSSSSSITSSTNIGTSSQPFSSSPSSSSPSVLGTNISSSSSSSSSSVPHSSASSSTGDIISGTMTTTSAPLYFIIVLFGLQGITRFIC